MQKLQKKDYSCFCCLSESCFVVYQRVRRKTENMKLYGSACVFIVCLCTGAGCCAHFLHAGNVYDKMLYKLLYSKLLWKQTKQSGSNSVDYRFHLPLDIYLQCTMKWIFVYHTTLNCQRSLVFVHTLRLTYSTLTHRTPTLQNKHSPVVCRAVKDEIYCCHSST